MNPIITTVEPMHAKPSIRNILTKDGVTNSLLKLAPHADITCDQVAPAHRQLLFVITGNITVGVDGLSTILQQDNAVLIPADRDCKITATDVGAKVLRVVLPPAQVGAPSIHTVAN